MVDVLQIGPIIIRQIWLYALLAAIVGFWAMQTVLKRKAPSELPILDVYSAALLWAILVWKVSPALTSPELLRNPLSLLVYPGTPFGTQLAILTVFIYVTITVWRRKISWKITMDTFTIGWLVASSVFFMTHWQYGLETSVPWGISMTNPELNYHPVNIYKLVALLAIGLFLLKVKFGVGKVTSVGLVGYGLMTMFISFIEPKTTVTIGLSLQQIFALTVTLIGLIAMFAADGEKAKD